MPSNLLFCTSILVLAIRLFAPQTVYAQYSKNATDRARQGIFIYRPKEDPPKASKPEPAKPSQAIAAPRATSRDDQRDEQRRLERDRDERERRQREWDRQDRAADERERMERERYARERQNNLLDRNSNPIVPNSFINDANRAFSGTATIVSVKQGLLQAKADGQLWQVKPEPGAKIEVVGTAGLDYLRPSHVVKFRAAFDPEATEKNKSVALVNSIEIVALGSNETPGAVPVEAIKADTPLAESTRWLQITGRIRSIKNGEMTIDTGTDSYRTQLDPEATIHVRVSDYMLARAGDQIEASGRVVSAGNALANKILITLTKPLGKPRSDLASVRASNEIAPQKSIAKAKTASN